MVGMTIKDNKIVNKVLIHCENLKTKIINNITKKMYYQI